jgi:hypothetical protein
MKIDIANLKKTTEAAIQKGKEEAARSDQEKAAIRAAEDAQMVAEAEAIIATIPSKCQTSAESKKNKALIMQEKHIGRFKTDFVKGFKGGWTAQITGGPGVLVIEACQKAGLKVDVQYQHDGCGMNAWAELYVSWD